MKEEIKEEEEEEEEEDDLEYFDTFPTIEELGYHGWLLKNPRPSWVSAKIMSQGLESRKKPTNPMKICNFVGRVRGLKVFVGNFTYECDFVVLEDTTSVIDHYLGGMLKASITLGTKGGYPNILKAYNSHNLVDWVVLAIVSIRLDLPY
ncbi:hypothetical protein Tco_1285668 [Tanacetum coccineum]